MKNNPTSPTTIDRRTDSVCSRLRTWPMTSFKNIKSAMATTTVTASIVNGAKKGIDDVLGPECELSATVDRDLGCLFAEDSDCFPGSVRALSAGDACSRTGAVAVGDAGASMPSLLIMIEPFLRELLSASSAARA